MEIEQPVAQPPQPVAQQPQRTLTGRFCRCLFTTIFYTQLTSLLIFVIYLTVRGLLFTKSTNFHPKKWYTPLLSSIAVAGVLSLFWKYLFVCNIRAIVKATLWFTPILTLSVAIFFLLYGNWVAHWVALPLVLYSIIQAVCGCLCINRQRHEFNFKMMSIATGSPPARTRSTAVILVSAILSVFYSGFLVAGIGGATATRTRTRLDVLFISIIVISLAWTMQVLKNVQQVAISKATYVYFKRGEVMSACDALGATFKNQLGSVCIGSTLVPLIVFIRGWIRGLNRCNREDDEEIYTSTQGCYWIAKHLILYGNRYGFVHVGVHNKGFVQASSDTWNEFRRAGLEQLIDFDLTSSICFCSAMAVGAISALTAGIWELLILKDHFLELTLYAFIIGYFVGRVSSAWLQACVMGYYVAYSENPQSDNFDNTMPQRIEQINKEKAKREAEIETENERRAREAQEDEEANMTYMYSYSH